MKKGER